MTEADLKLFVRLGQHVWWLEPSAIESYAREIEARYGELMFQRTLTWLHDPWARESPLATYLRVRDFLVNPASKEGKHAL